VIFCSFSDAVRDHPALIEQYLGTVVPYTDNFYATLNSAVFTDGSFVYIPKGVRCPMELSTYFRINAANTGPVRADADRRRRRQPRQLPRGLHRADARREPAARGGRRAGGARRRADQVLDGAELVPGRRERRRRHLQLRDQARRVPRRNAKISWTQVETGSAITWKYPSCVLTGENSVGEFYSVAVANHYQQADTGTKMIHIGRNTRSTIVSKGISAGHAQNAYRGS
jgi:Fe-S cluster assembly protein SufB